jgi:uncharacterized protein with GYD domain
VAKYVVLVSLSEEGRKQLANNVVGESLGTALASSKGQLCSLHITLGAYDAVAVIELDAALMAAFMLSVSRELGDPTILQAFDEQEAFDGILRWDKEHEDQGKLGP